MEKLFVKIAASLLTAAIIGNVTFLFQVNARLARIETQLQMASVKVANSQ